MREEQAADVAPVRKPFLELGGRPLVEHALDALDACPSVREIVIVAHPEDIEAHERACVDRSAYAKVVAVVPGGAERSDSVRAGARWCAFDVDVIAVHDAARPLVRAEEIDATIEQARRTGAALLAMPVQDTIKVSQDGQHILRTLARHELWAAQTPQAFGARRFRKVLERAAEDEQEATDDASLWEKYEGPVDLVRGTSTGFKITSPPDLLIARALLAAGIDAGDPEAGDHS